MVKIYTKAGDHGQTSLLSGERVNKNNILVELYGEVDELNSYLGLSLATLTKGNLKHKSQSILDFGTKIQQNLFVLGARLACHPDKWEKYKLSDVDSKILGEMESSIDQMEKELGQLKNFILPGGSLESASAHICRVNSRRLERNLIAVVNAHEEYKILAQYIPFINRLSDYFFVLARKLNQLKGVQDVLWNES